MSENLRAKDKLLFTPGPLTTMKRVKEAALHDLGSRDEQFISVVKEIRSKLLELAHVKSPEYETIIMQGSGTFGIESVITSAVPETGCLLNIINGAYGRRISQIAIIHSIKFIELVYDENQLPDLIEIESVLNSNPAITHISVIHGETTTGLLNPIGEIGEIARLYNVPLIVDAMSTFGAYDIDLDKLNISFLISSSNKCIEGIPGFSFILAKKTELEKCKDQSRSLTLDLYDQWSGLDLSGQFRFTPPVQALLSFHQALIELEKEGGIKARAIRYATNNLFLVSEMKKLGFELYLSDKVRSYIITSFVFPDHKNFSFELFYSKLSEDGFVIYPGKLSKTECFRIGNIGQIHQADIKALVSSIRDALIALKIFNTHN